MLLEVSPVSRIRLKLTVTVFVTGGGTGSGASGLLAEALFEEMPAAAREVASEVGEFEVAPEAFAVGKELGVFSASGVGAASAEPMAGGSESAGGAAWRRVMITVSPASFEMPPASARTSIREI